MQVVLSGAIMDIKLLREFLHSVSPKGRQPLAEDAVVSTLQKAFRNTEYAEKDTGNSYTVKLKKKDNYDNVFIGVQRQKSKKEPAKNVWVVNAETGDHSTDDYVSSPFSGDGLKELQDVLKTLQSKTWVKQA
jgi:hypothetical protein